MEAVAPFLICKMKYRISNLVFGHLKCITHGPKTDSSANEKWTMANGKTTTTTRLSMTTGTTFSIVSPTLAIHMRAELFWYL